MQALFSPTGELALVRLLERRVLLGFDFDGTLAPIVARPQDARLPAGLAGQLATLAQRLPVAVLTGRSLADVSPRLGFTPRYLIGNHGAEGLGWLARSPGLGWLRQRLQAQAPALQQAGVQVEDKGLSLALHYRLASDADAARRVIGDCLADLPPDLNTFGGKYVVNVVQKDAPDKGDAALTLLQASGCDSLLFAGDDVNDEAVFARARSDWLTIRIGPPLQASSAMYFLPDQAQMGALLARIAQLLAAD
jgi:trehalose 6-phosphate phosphatase